MAASIAEQIRSNQRTRFSDAFSRREASKRIRSANVTAKEELANIERGFSSGGLVARLFEDNPFTGFANIVNRPDTGIKSYEGLTPDRLSRMSTHDVRNVMSNSNPHVSAAITDFQEYVRPGGKIYPSSNPVLDRWMDNMERYDTSLDGVIDSLSESMFLHGGYFYESVYDEEGMPQRIVPLDPYSAAYTRSKDALGDYYELHQRQAEILYQFI